MIGNQEISGTSAINTDAADRYADIINLGHHVSRCRNKMSMHERAAQFAPFAALTGLEQAIDESCRRHNNGSSVTLL